MLASRLRYYLASIPRLLRGFRNWPTALALFLGLPVGRPVALVLRDTGLVLRVRTPLDAWLVKEVCIERQYESASVPIQDGWTVIDVGGGIGEFALDVAKRFPRSVVWAYEPAPDAFHLLEQNISANRLANVQARSDAVGTPATTLDEIFRLNRIEHCDYLKIDCEGCEYGVLLSASEDTLRRIGVVCLEYHDRLTGRSHLELKGRLEQSGFRVSIHPSPVHRGQGLLGAARIG